VEHDAEPVTAEFEDPITAGEAADVEVVDVREDGGYVTPLECAGEDAVYVASARSRRCRTASRSGA
jgi:aspartate-semialdehyde dehydrogenase